MAWVDPFNHKMSSYGVDIASSLDIAISECDQDLIDKYLKELCQKEAGILKHQRGDGFGGNVYFLEFAKLQLSDSDLKHAPTHTKPIENLYCSEDITLSRFGVKVFKK